MIPARLDPRADRNAICQLALLWKVEPELSQKIHDLAAAFPIALTIISGYRTASEQAAEPQGAADNVSTHRTCPATGADLHLVGFSRTTAPTATRRAFKAAAEKVGLRVGGGSKPDPETGLPWDWTHVDLGPRAPGTPSGS